MNTRVLRRFSSPRTQRPTSVANGTEISAAVTAATQGVIPALLGLPRGVCDVLNISPLDLLGMAQATADGDGMILEIAAGITMTVRPFQRLIVFGNPNRINNRCEVSYWNGGFLPEDINRLIGWYTLACRESSDTALQIAERLGSSLTVTA